MLLCYCMGTALNPLLYIYIAIAAIINTGTWFTLLQYRNKKKELNRSNRSRVVHVYVHVQYSSVHVYVHVSVHSTRNSHPHRGPSKQPSREYGHVCTRVVHKPYACTSWVRCVYI